MSEFAHTLEFQVDKLEFLLQSLIKMSRLETGTFSMHIEERNLHNTLVQAVKDVWQAAEKKTGARALRAIIEKFMLDIMYEIPKDDLIGRVTITEDYINHEGAPRIEMRESGEAKLLTQRQE